MATKTNFKENFFRVVAVLGLIAVLLLGAWGIIQLAFFIPTLFSGSGSVGSAPLSATSSAVTTGPAASTAATPASKPAATPAKTSKTSSKYVASGRTQNLYGYADLAVYITANPGSVRAGSRVSMQFIIENAGTNVAQSGWAFSATLPYNPVYTFQSAPQQALYPGDKIVYTLTYDAQYGNLYDGGINPCQSGWSYPCTQNPTIYGGPGTCNAYGPCAATNYYSPYAPGLPTYQQTASVQADNYNQIWEQNESNNYGSITYTVY